MNKRIHHCTDQVIGDILSGWRYDISGVSPEMRMDYESHLAECSHCRARQRLHRTIDVGLIGIFTISSFAFMLAIAVIHRIEPLRHWAIFHLHLGQTEIALSLQQGAFAGVFFSMMAWLLVAIATPAPVYLSGVAREQARVFQELRNGSHR